MDDAVKHAMIKWPNVPDCYGWLGLDARGQWCMRDAQTQAAGPFAQSKGTPLHHEGLIAFINRNYAADAAGRWFFQNGPQRVFVELQAAPYVFRIQADGTLLSHTHESTHAQASWMDEHGRVFVQSALGFGLVHSQDVFAFSERQAQEEAQRSAAALAGQALAPPVWQPQSVAAAQLPAQFGFVLSPQASAPSLGE